VDGHKIPYSGTATNGAMAIDLAPIANPRVMTYHGIFLDTCEVTDLHIDRHSDMWTCDASSAKRRMSRDMCTRVYDSRELRTMVQAQCFGVFKSCFGITQRCHKNITINRLVRQRITNDAD
jgi:hypothetical protein